MCFSSPVVSDVTRAWIAQRLQEVKQSSGRSKVSRLVKRSLSTLLLVPEGMEADLKAGGGRHGSAVTADTNSSGLLTLVEKNLTIASNNGFFKKGKFNTPMGSKEMQKEQRIHANIKTGDGARF